MKKVDKPWGYEIWYAYNNRYAGKLLHVEAGSKLSRQYHRNKHETWLVIKGKIFATVGSDNGSDKKIQMNEGDWVELPPGTIHRIEALLDSDIIEWSSPELDDLIRLEDEYGRLDEY